MCHACMCGLVLGVLDLRQTVYKQMDVDTHIDQEPSCFSALVPQVGDGSVRVYESGLG